MMKHGNSLLDSGQINEWPQGDLLDRALSKSLSAPPLPLGFHQRLRTTIADEVMNDVIARRSALEAEYLQRLAELRRGYIRVRRNTLAIWLATAFTVGACAMAFLPWLAEINGTDASTLMLLITVTAGLGIAAIVPLKGLQLLQDN